jgi:uncharacterized protein YutE (UPF0331/DUF86 family)
VRRNDPGGAGVKIDEIRIQMYLSEIRRNSLALRQLLEQNELVPDSVALKAAKYILIELAEAMSNTIQHLLAKDKGVAVSGYVDAVVKAFENGLVDKNLFDRLKPFFDFRNSLVHRYWRIDDQRLIDNIRNGKDDFDLFISQIEARLEENLKNQ